MAPIYDMTKTEVIDRLLTKLRVLRGDKPTRLWGVPRGGMCAVMTLLGEVGGFVAAASPTESDVIVDDIIDSGATKRKFLDAFPGKPFIGAVDKTEFDADIGWVRFWWESETGPEDAVVRLLEFIGENPKREGLVDTPKRVLKALDEMTRGRNENPGEILGRVFEERYDELIISRGIPFTSLCEHHMLPFSGTADVGYIPGLKSEGNGPDGDVSLYRIVGLSKLARLVDCFARRLQVQERMTSQIANAINEHLKPEGVGVVVRAEHSCQACRGVKKSGTEMVTSVFLGVLRSDQAARSEFLSLCNGGR